MAPKSVSPGSMALRSRLLLFFKGIAMGAADVVPGVSGGTIAFITGIYDELIDSIKAVGFNALRDLFVYGPKQFWQTINGTFLLTLGAGIVLSITTLARLVTYCLDTSPVLVWAFFFGLIMASVVYIWRQLDRFNWRAGLWFIAGISVALVISFAPRAEIEATPMVVFGAGMVAICAMILPGISGSFILLLLGLYTQIMTAISELDIPLLIAFNLGCVCGLMMFSRLLSWLLHHHRQSMLALLTGFLAGSLMMVWPWKNEVIREGGSVASAPVWPWQYYADSDFLIPTVEALAMMLAGLLLLFILESLAGKLHRGAT